jgi:hypothetical protein
MLWTAVIPYQRPGVSGCCVVSLNSLQCAHLSAYHTSTYQVCRRTKASIVAADGLRMLHYCRSALSDSRLRYYQYEALLMCMSSNLLRESGEVVGLMKSWESQSENRQD